MKLFGVLLALGGFLPVFAQDIPTDSLGGKVVHLYLPADDVDSLILRNAMRPMRKSGRYWHSVVLVGDRYNSNQGFFFSNPNYSRFLTKEGLGNAERTRFQLADFQGKQEMWIVVDPAGPVTAPPAILVEPPKIVNVLNPWAETGPNLVLPGGTSKPMLARPDRCGWFMAFLLKPTEMSLHLQERIGTGTYGTGGRGSAGDYDLAALFAAKGKPDTLGTELWLDTELNVWQGTSPDKVGSCGFGLAATVRDFSSAHPDFDFSGLVGDFIARGRVETLLGANRKPVRSSAPSTVNGRDIFNHFDSWWKTDTANATPALRSYETCVDIPLSKAGSGWWEYDSHNTPARGFFPIDNFTNPNNEKYTSTCSIDPNNPNLIRTGGPPANLGFCTEIHAGFIYRPGQKFSLRGDDDVWVFIDGKLVIDLGGIHNPMVDSVDLDKLDLTPGEEYAWDLFICERQPCGSALRIRTDLFLKQPKPLEAVPIAGPGPAQGYRIVKRAGAVACGVEDSLQRGPAANLTFQLRDAAGKVVATLADGEHYNGSLVITAAPPNRETQVTVDTGRVVTTLSPGDYRVVAFEAANPDARAEIPFTVRMPPTGTAPGAKNLSRYGKPRSHDALGRKREGRVKLFHREIPPGR